MSEEKQVERISLFEEKVRRDSSLVERFLGVENTQEHNIMHISTSGNTSDPSRLLMAIRLLQGIVSGDIGAVRACLHNFGLLTSDQNVAFLMATHPRLGANSPARNLPTELFRVILSYLWDIDFLNLQIRKGAFGGSVYLSWADVIWIREIHFTTTRRYSIPQPKWTPKITLQMFAHTEQDEEEYVLGNLAPKYVEDKDTLLHLACRLKHFDIVTFLASQAPRRFRNAIGQHAADITFSDLENPLKRLEISAGTYEAIIGPFTLPLGSSTSKACFEVLDNPIPFEGNLIKINLRLQKLPTRPLFEICVVEVVPSCLDDHCGESSVRVWITDRRQIRVECNERKLLHEQSIDIHPPLHILPHQRVGLRTCDNSSLGLSCDIVSGSTVNSEENTRANHRTAQRWIRMHPIDPQVLPEGRVLILGQEQVEDKDSLGIEVRTLPHCISLSGWNVTLLAASNPVTNQ